MTLAEFISKHTTVTAFAAKLGRSRAQVHRYIRGDNLSKSVIEEICRATDDQVRPSDFFAPTPSHKEAAQP